MAYISTTRTVGVTILIARCHSPSGTRNRRSKRTRKNRLRDLSRRGRQSSKRTSIGRSPRQRSRVSLNPNYAFAYNCLGSIHTYSGRPLEAIAVIEHAMRLDPAWSQQYLHFLGTAYLLAGKYETAAALLRQRIFLVPETDFSRAVLASVLVISVKSRRPAHLATNSKDTIRNTHSENISADNPSGKRMSNGLPRVSRKPDCRTNARGRTTLSGVEKDLWSRPVFSAVRRAAIRPVLGPKPTFRRGDNCFTTRRYHLLA